MAKSKDDEIADLKQQRREINRKINKKRAQKRQREEQERNSRLVQWGIVVENLLGDSNKKFSEQTLANLCFEYLSGRSLDRALTGPLQTFAEQRDQGQSYQSEQSQQSSQQQRPQDQQSQQQQDRQQSQQQDQQQGDSSNQNPPPQS